MWPGVPRSGMMLAALVRLRLGRRALQILCWENLILLLYEGPGDRSVSLYLRREWSLLRCRAMFMKLFFRSLQALRDEIVLSTFFFAMRWAVTRYVTLGLVMNAQHVVCLNCPV